MADNLLEALQTTRKNVILQRLGRRPWHTAGGRANRLHPGSALCVFGRAGSCQPSELTSLPDVGPEIASCIRAFFENEQNIEMLARLKEAGLDPIQPDSAGEKHRPRP